MSNSITADQLSGLIQGLQGTFGTLESTVANKVMAQDLPMIGPLGDAEGALQAFSALDADIIQSLTDLLNGTGGTAGSIRLTPVGADSAADYTAQQIQDSINDAIARAGYAQNVQVTVSGAGVLTVNLSDSDSKTFHANLNDRFGLPNMPLLIHGTADASLGFTLDIAATVDISGGFSLSAPTGHALHMGVDVTAPTFRTNIKMGWVYFRAVDQGSALHGSFDLDTDGTATFTGDANLDLHLASDFGTGNYGMPSFNADLQGGWAFTASEVGGDITTFGGTPSIAINNVNLDFGSVIEDYIKPILDAVRPILQPLSQALTIFNTNVDFLNIIPGLLAKVDKAGAISAGGQDIPDGHISLVDFLKAAAPDTNFAPLEKLIDLVGKLVRIAAFLDGVSLGPTNYNIGSFQFGQDIRTPGFSLSDITPQVTGGPADLGSFLANLPAEYSTQDGLGETLGSLIGDLVDGEGISLPLLKDPMSLFRAMLGNTTADLFDINIPDFSVPAFGSIDANGTPISKVNLLTFPFLPAIPELSLTIGGALQAAFGINIGMDTTGLQEFANSGDPSQILDGLYIANPVVDGSEQPIASVQAAIEMDLQLSAYVASVAGGGDISGGLSFFLADTGKNYIRTLASELATAPLSALNATGSISVGLDAAVKVFGADITSWHSPRFTLLSFDQGAPGTGSVFPPTPPTNIWVGRSDSSFNLFEEWDAQPALATVSGVPYRLYGNTIIGDDVFLFFSGVPSVDLKSLQLGTASTIQLRDGAMHINGNTIDSANSGLIDVTGAATLELGASINNTGTIRVGEPQAGTDDVTAVIAITGQLVELYGGGLLTMPADGRGRVIGGTRYGANPGRFPALWNIDNTIIGAGIIGDIDQYDGTIAFDLINSGTVTAQGTSELAVWTRTTNSGRMQAVGDGTANGPLGGLILRADVDNHAGTIAAIANGQVRLDPGITITAGTLLSDHANTNSQITTYISLAGSAASVLNGGTDGMTIAAVVVPGIGTTIALTGLIQGESYRHLLSPATSNARVITGDGTVALDNAIITGGEFALTQPDGALLVTGTTTLDGAADPGAIGIDGVMTVATGNTLVIDGQVDAGRFNSATIDLNGGLLLVGRTGAASAQLAPGAGIATPGGPHGVVQLDDVSGAVITGFADGATLDNGWTIRGAGTLGNGMLHIINDLGGTIDADAAGALEVNGPRVINLGTIRASGGGGLTLDGTIDQHGTQPATGLPGTGTLLGDGGTVTLNNALVRGGIFASTGAGVIAVQGSATLDGAATPLDITGTVVVASGQTLTVHGTISGTGTLHVDGSAGPATLDVAGGAILQQVTLQLDNTAGGGDPTNQVVTSLTTGALENASGVVSGFGTVGGASLLLVNDAGGQYIATGGALVVDAAAGTMVNAGTMAATDGGTLELRGSFDLAGGTVAALTGSAAGVVALDGATLLGGTLASTAGDDAAMVTVTGNGGTLDGSATPVTIAPGALVQAGPNGTLTATGAIANQGTIRIGGDASGGGTGALLVSGAATLTGAGALVLTELANPSGAFGTQLVTGGTLVNADNTISGYGMLGGGALELANQAAGVIVAATSTLEVDTGATTLDNAGTLAGITGTLQLDGAVANTGSVLALAGGVAIDGTFVNAGLLHAGTAGTITVAGTLADNGGTATIGSQGAVVLAGGLVSGGTLDITTQGIGATTTGTTSTLSGTVLHNAGTFTVGGSGVFAASGALAIDGSVQFTGGGVLALAAPGGAQQTITGTSPSATLDVMSQTITGEGLIGTGGMTLLNEAGGTIEATSGQLVLDAGNSTIASMGVMGATGLAQLAIIDGTVDATAGGLFVIRESGGFGGVIVLRNATLLGGELDDASMGSGGGRLEVEQTSTLDASISDFAIDAHTVAEMQAGATLVLVGTITNAGTIRIAGNGTAFGGTPGTADLHALGDVTLTGGGMVELTQFGGADGDYSTQVITGGTLDNVDNTIQGYGLLGAALQFNNQSTGTVSATAHTLMVDTGTTITENAGLMQGLGAVLELRNTVSGRNGGQFRALAANGASGTLLLDSAILLGGTISTDTLDHGSALRVTGNATLDGTSGAVALTPGALAVVDPLQMMTLKGAIANAGTIQVGGAGAIGWTSTLVVSGAVTTSGGGTLELRETFAATGGTTTQVIIGADASATLDNAGDVIAGYGMLGAGTLTLLNELGGTIEAADHILLVDTGANTIVNAGLIQAIAGGTLQLRGVVDATGGGTFAAFDAGGPPATMLLDAATILGGSFATDPADPASTIQLLASATLDGTGAPVTIEAGALFEVAPTTTLTVHGSLDNQGTLLLAGAGGNGWTGTALVGGSVRLSGGGLVRMTETTAPTGTEHAQLITGSAATDALENVDNSIVGYGQIGGGTLALTNDAAGTITAGSNRLVVDTGANAIINAGLMQGEGGTLELASAIANTGTLRTGNGGLVIDAAATNSGLIRADDAGTITVSGTILDAAGSTAVKSGGALVLNGGTLSGGSVTIDAGAQGVIATNAGSNASTLADVTLHNAGSITLAGAGGNGWAASLIIAGAVTLDGGGTLRMAEIFAATGNDRAQLITGGAATDSLENVDNTLTGYGRIGGGTLALTNDVAGTITAGSNRLLVDTGANAIINAGLIQGEGGTLELASAIASTGTLRAANGGLVIDAAATNSGLIRADDAGTITLSGTIIDATGTTAVKSGGVLALSGGTLSSGSVTIDAGAQGVIATTAGPNASTLADVTLHNAGSITLAGAGANGWAARLTIAGAVTLDGGGTLRMAEIFAATGTDQGQVITGTAPGDTFDNKDNFISGYGKIGGGTLALINEAGGTIDANATLGGSPLILLLDTGIDTIANAGLMEGTLDGILDIASPLANTGSILADHGTVILAGGATNSGHALAGAAGLLDLRGTLADAGGTLDVAAGGTLALDNGGLSGGSVTLAAGALGLIATTAGPNSSTLADVTLHNIGTIALRGAGANGWAARLTIAGAVTLDGGGALQLAEIFAITGSTFAQVITGADAASRLENTDNLIHGYGRLGGGQLALLNHAAGTIDADGILENTPATLVVDAGAGSVVNAGMIRASLGILDLHGTVANAGGTIAADGGTVDLDGASITGGRLAAMAGGVMEVIGTGAALAGLTNAAALQIYGPVTLTLQGAIANAGSLLLGGAGANGWTASLAIAGGVTLSGGGQVVMAEYAVPTGSVFTQLITGTAPGATLENIDNRITGYGRIGVGALDVTNDAQGVITATGSGIEFDPGAAGHVFNAGTIRSDGGALHVLQGSFDNAGLFAGHGEIAATTHNTGTIEATDGTLVIDHDVGGTLVIDAGATLELHGTISASAVIFGGAGAVLRLADPLDFSGPILGFAPGETIVLGGFSATALDAASGGLTVEQETGPSVSFTFTGDTLPTDFSDTLDGGDTDIFAGDTVIVGGLPCYAAGTRILTARGEVPVEALRDGDLAATLSGLKPIRWIGRTRVNLARHPAPHLAAPIRIAAGALGPRTPHRDLLLSPDHALLIDGVLMPAHALVNDASITRVDGLASVTYFHIELDRHDILLAEGAPAESYLDTGNRAQFEGQATRVLHPDLSARSWDEQACRPLHLAGPLVESARAALQSRAEALGYARSPDAAFALVVAGQSLEPLAHQGDEWHFRLPANTASVRLHSRSTVPLESGAADDRRRLGVPVQAIRWDGETLPLDAVAPGTGFHLLEPGGWRWTNGNAELHLPPRDTACVLSLRIPAWALYWFALCAPDRRDQVETSGAAAGRSLALPSAV